MNFPVPTQKQRTQAVHQRPEQTVKHDARAGDDLDGRRLQQRRGGSDDLQIQEIPKQSRAECERQHQGIGQRERAVSEQHRKEGGARAVQRIEGGHRMLHQLRNERGADEENGKREHGQLPSLLGTTTNKFSSRDMSTAGVTRTCASNSRTRGSSATVPTTSPEGKTPPLTPDE